MIAPRTGRGELQGGPVLAHWLYKLWMLYVDLKKVQVLLHSSQDDAPVAPEFSIACQCSPCLSSTPARRAYKDF